jgi:hypothetical protein
LRRLFLNGRRQEVTLCRLCGAFVSKVVLPSVEWNMNGYCRLEPTLSKMA